METKQNIENGHEFVDLGLSVKWATFNVGANKPEEYGEYFAWGETEPKRIYNLGEYKWYDKKYDEIMKYNTSIEYGLVDNKIVLELADDAAHVNWGGSWRMPTNSEWRELLNNCEWETKKGINGIIVTSKINGSSILLPLSGFYGDGYSCIIGKTGEYWSSVLDKSLRARSWTLSTEQIIGACGVRYYGMSVRPVCE